MSIQETKWFRRFGESTQFKPSKEKHLCPSHGRRKNKNKTQLVNKGHKQKIKLLFFIEKLLHEDKNMNVLIKSVGGVQANPTLHRNKKGALFPQCWVFKGFHPMT